MHMAWVFSGGKIQECPLCIDEGANPDNANFQPVDLLHVGESNSHPLPCRKHGDPRKCLPANIDAIEIFTLMAKHQNFVFQEYQQGDKTRRERHLDLSVCLGLISLYQVEARETLWKLDILLEELNGGY